MNTKAAYNYYKEYILNENKRILFENIHSLSMV